MNDDIRLIVNAIESIKQGDSIFKDYVFPIASAFFTSILGALIAYFFFKYQEVIKIEKDKMDTANKWTLLVSEAKENLIAIKQNYHGLLGDDPVQRALAIPTVLFTAKPIIQDYSRLSFVVTKDLKGKYPKWSQIPQIRARIHNYNYLLDLWCKRNEVERPIKKKVLQQYSDKAFVDIELAKIIDCVGEAEVVSLVDLTEHVIKLTDDLLIEFDDFLSNFPVFAKTLIDTKRLEAYGSVLTYSNNHNKSLLALLEKSPDSNYELIAKLFGTTKEQLEKRYSTGMGNDLNE